MLIVLYQTMISEGWFIIYFNQSYNSCNFMYFPSILENIIRENHWGGADIRRGGDPILRNNLICYGYSDGVVIGERGKGLIEGNNIYGNECTGLYFNT